MSFLVIQIVKSIIWFKQTIIIIFLIKKLISFLILINIFKKVKFTNNVIKALSIATTILIIIFQI